MLALLILVVRLHTIHRIAVTFRTNDVGRDKVHDFQWKQYIYYHYVHALCRAYRCSSCCIFPILRYVTKVCCVRGAITRWNWTGERKPGIVRADDDDVASESDVAQSVAIAILLLLLWNDESLSAALRVLATISVICIMHFIFMRRGATGHWLWTSRRRMYRSPRARRRLCIISFPSFSFTWHTSVILVRRRLQNIVRLLMLLYRIYWICAQFAFSCPHIISLSKFILIIFLSS